MLPFFSVNVVAAPCGFSVDCPATYNLEDVNRSAAQWCPECSEWRRGFERHRIAAAAACARSLTGSMKGHTGLPNGGYCLHEAVPPRPNVTLPGGRSYRQPLEYMYTADGIIVAALLELLSTGRSLSDFGAGVGEYGHALMSLDPTVRWFGYDGAGNVEAWTNDFVRWFDLTIPLSLPRTDWVMSLEVGEHIPSSAEHMVLRNLHAHNCRGIILSWAVLNQIGFDHINNHRNEYVIHQVTQLGYVLNHTLTSRLRSGRPVAGIKTWRWLRKVMAFDRIEPLADCEAGAVQALVGQTGNGAQSADAQVIATE